MSLSRVKVIGRRLRWFFVGAAVFAAPKCLVCLAVYAGIGALFGLKIGGPELCGGAGSSMIGRVALGVVAIAGVVGTVALLRRAARWRRAHCA